MLSKKLISIIDFLVPFSRFIRQNENVTPFRGWQQVVFYCIPHTFFVYWLCSLIPYIGTLAYALVLIPLSIYLHIQSKHIGSRVEQARIVLLYYVVILIGLGGLWSFIGHTFLADMVANAIGWALGSPFQTELAFYTLGSSIAAFLAIRLKGHMITALVISKSIFWYGAAFVHIKDIIVMQNYSTSNIGIPLIGDIIFPTILLWALYIVLKNDLDI